MVTNMNLFSTCQGEDQSCPWCGLIPKWYITSMDGMVSSTQTFTHTFHKLHNEGSVSCLCT